MAFLPTPSLFRPPNRLSINRIAANCEPRQVQPRCANVAIVGASSGVATLLTKYLNSATEPNAPLSTPVTSLTLLSRNPSKLPPPNERTKNVELPCIMAASSIPKMREIFSDIDIVVISIGTTAFPSRAWKGSNTPKNVDDLGVKHICQSLDGVKRVILMSSIGVTRSKQFPFSILNLFGVLDAKGASEKHLLRFAESHDCDVIIIRPGRLMGEPHTNIGMIRSKGQSGRNIGIFGEDSGRGDVMREDVAKVLEACVRWEMGGKTIKAAVTVLNNDDVEEQPLAMRLGQFFE